DTTPPVGYTDKILTGGIHGSYLAGTVIIPLENRFIWLNAGIQYHNGSRIHTSVNISSEIDHRIRMDKGDNRFSGALTTRYHGKLNVYPRSTGSAGSRRRSTLIRAAIGILVVGSIKSKACCSGQFRRRSPIRTGVAYLD